MSDTSLARTSGAANPARVVATTRIDWIAVTAVLAAVLVGLVARVLSLGAIGFNSDEAVYAGQAASLSGDPLYAPYFAIFRAHPLLIQFILSMVFKFGVSDVAARAVSVAFGVAAIPLVYLVGRELFSRRVGILSALVLALLPYHVIVSRQVLLDGPETTLFLLTMYLIARYASTSSVRYLYVAGLAAGMTFLAKETAVLVLPVIAAFFLMTPAVRLRLGQIGLTLLGFAVAIAPYPISIAVSGASDTARQFLLWQLLRRPNHTFTFYGEVLFGALGPLLLAVAVVGLVLGARRATWQDRLILAWVIVPLAFYQAWPVKGYQYLLPIAPALIMVAMKTLDDFARRAAIAAKEASERARSYALLQRAAVGVLSVALLLSVAAPTLAAAGRGAAEGSLAGTGGLPGGREAGQWVAANVPSGGAFMTIGPTLSNIIQFYGHRRSQGLSVSPNPLHRNPAYDPIGNPDSAIRSLKIQYVAWDIWSASRSPYFASLVLRYVSRYHGKLVYQQLADVRLPNGGTQRRTVIQIFEVRP